ncbi:MAG: short-chain dehydrogenase, partial [Chloroflexota bacterium]
LDSVRAAVASLDEPIEALVMNAGGVGNSTAGDKSQDGVTNMFAVNVLGHVVLFDELMKAKKLTKVALYAGSEAARGIPQMGMKQPTLQTSSVDEFAAICDGSFFGEKFDPMTAYGYVKYIAALWMSSEARKHPDVRIITMSPGGTSGTNGFEDMSPVMKFMFKYIGLRLMPMFGLMHGLEVGAKRYVDGLNDGAYQSGVFYASKTKATGPIVDQSTLLADFGNETFQDNANEAIHRFIN